MSSSLLMTAEQVIKPFVNTGSSCPVSQNSTWLLDTVLKFWLKNLFLILLKLSILESVLEESKVHELNIHIWAQWGHRCQSKSSSGSCG